MFRYVLLALVGIYTTAAQPFRVNIQYTDPRLSLSVHEADRDVTSVLFNFGVGKPSRVERATRSGAGNWEYHGLFPTRAGDVIHATAEIHFSSGLSITTPEAMHRVGGSGGLLPPGGRRVRGVIFRDDFNNYNRGNWRPEISMFGGLNWEFQVYTPEAKNIYTANGNIYLRPTLTVDDPRFDENFLHHGVMDVAKIWGSCTNNGNYGCSREGQYGLLPPVMSGKVSSNPTLRFGTAEIRAKLPRGDWLWPAIWMMPKSSHYGDWPRSGEIDIMESRGNGGDMGVNTVSSTLHWGPAWDQNRFGLTHGERHNGDFSGGFHTYRLEWTGDHLQTFVDNILIMNAEAPNGFWAKGGFSGGNIWAGGNKMAPFDQDFYLMLNVAVGGTNGYFPDNANYGARKPWTNNSPHAAEDFWNARGAWLPTWNGENAALAVDYVEFRN